MYLVARFLDKSPNLGHPAKIHQVVGITRGDATKALKLLEVLAMAKVNEANVGYYVLTNDFRAHIDSFGG